MRLAPPAFCLAAAVLLASPAPRAQTMPNIITPSGLHANESTAQRGNDGHFYIEADINGAPLHMLFDTGASSIVLRQEDAAQVGVDVQALNFSSIGQTANGRAEFAPVLLSSVTVGGITRHNVAAAVARPGTLATNLLGQTFLRRLNGYRTEGNRLVLQGD